MYQYLIMQIKLDKIAQIQPGVHLKVAEGNVHSPAYLLGLKDFDEALNQIGQGSQVDVEAVKPKYFIKKDDLLFSVRLRFNVFNLSISTNENLVSSNNFVIIRCDTNKVKPEYLKWYLNHPQQQELLAFLSQSNGGLPYISAKKLGDFKINLPSINRQEEIIKINKCLVRQQELLSRLKEKTEIYIQSILQKASEQ